MSEVIEVRIEVSEEVNRVCGENIMSRIRLGMHNKVYKFVLVFNEAVKISSEPFVGFLSVLNGYLSKNGGAIVIEGAGADVSSLFSLLKMENLLRKEG